MPAAILAGKNHPQPCDGIVRAFICFAMGIMLCASAMADAGKLAEIDARYQSERAACESAPPSVDRIACLREAAAARDEARRGLLNGAQSNYDQNALARCAALPPEERDNCIRRTRGEGETKGNVTEGGIYREYKEYTLPSPSPSPAD